MSPKTEVIELNVQSQYVTELAIRAVKARRIEEGIRCLMVIRQHLRQEAVVVEEKLVAAKQGKASPVSS